MTASSEQDVEGAGRRVAPLGRVILSIVGLMLLIAACVAVFGESDGRAKAIESAKHAPLNLVIGLVLLPAANLAISAAVFHVLLRRFGKVRYSELLTLMGSAWLLNYLPFRPGMAGRFAYHKSVNGIAIRHSFRTLIESMGCSAMAAVAGLVICRVVNSSGRSDLEFMLIGATAALAVAAAGWFARTRAIHAGAVCCACGLRIADLLVWTLRYFAAFSIAGHPISATHACVIACASQVAMAVPLSGNGLGLREWSVGWAGAGVTKTLAASAGLAADLVNRAAELVTAVPLGVACTVVAARKAAATSAMRGSAIKGAKNAGDHE